VSEDGIEMTMSEAMQNLAAALDRILNGEKVATGGERNNGFILLVFPYGDQSGMASRISNGVATTDVMRIFEEQIRQHKESNVKDELSNEEIASNMAKVNGIMHELRDGKITRDVAHRRLVDECSVADQGLDKLLDAYDPGTKQ
jgi:hypothetical protein